MTERLSRLICGVMVGGGGGQRKEWELISLQLIVVDGYDSHDEDHSAPLELCRCLVFQGAAERPVLEFCSGGWSRSGLGL